jgi:hypothetical protein
LKLNYGQIELDGSAADFLPGSDQRGRPEEASFLAANGSRIL